MNRQPGGGRPSSVSNSHELNGGGSRHSLGVTRRGLKMTSRGPWRNFSGRATPAAGLLNSAGKRRRARRSVSSVKNITDAQLLSSLDHPHGSKIGSQKNSSRPDDGNPSSPPAEWISAKSICATKVKGHGRSAWSAKNFLPEIAGLHGQGTSGGRSGMPPRRLAPIGASAPSSRGPGSRIMAGRAAAASRGDHSPSPA